MKNPKIRDSNPEKPTEDDVIKKLEILQDRLARLEVSSSIPISSTAATGSQTATNSTHETVYYPTPEIKKECCCFEIILYRARVLTAQGGSGSIELNDGGGPSNTDMELIFGATADGFSAAYPGVASHVSMGESGGWLVFNQKVALVAGNQSVAVSASARELEVSRVEAVASRGEYGNSETAYLNLDCNCQVIPVQLEIQLSGGSMNKRGRVLVEMTAKKVCCPC